jgi:hypothetical protein
MLSRLLILRVFLPLSNVSLIIDFLPCQWNAERAGSCLRVFDKIFELLLGLMPPEGAD